METWVQEVLTEETGDDADADRPRVGWFCTYTPLELLHAAGLRPVRLMGRLAPTDRADAYLSANMCPYVRACLEAALDGDYRDLAGVVFLNSCNAMAHLYHVWDRYVHTPFVHFLDLPRLTTQGAEEYFSARLVEMMAALATRFPPGPGPGDLWAAIEEYEELRRLLALVRERQRRSPHPLSGASVQAVLRTVAATGPRQASRLLSSLQDRWPEEDGAHEPAVPSPDVAARPHGMAVLSSTRVAGPAGLARRPRILLAGTLHDPGLVDLIEEAGFCVVADDLCTGSRLLVGTAGPPARQAAGEDLLRHLARLYLRKPPCPRMADWDARVAHLLGLVEEYRAEGVIFYALKFCDTMLYDFPGLRQALVNRGLPVLFLTGEYHLGGTGQLRTRLQAFSEMF